MNNEQKNEIVKSFALGMTAAEIAEVEGITEAEAEQISYDVKIIDISKHNGVIDFNKVKADGISGVIIRAGYGRYISQKDYTFETYYADAKAAGFNVGAKRHQII